MLDGRAWITEAGRSGDAFVERGARYEVSGDGVVLVGAEKLLRVALRRDRLRWLRRWWDARQARAELEALPEHRLRDLGLARDQIRELV
ncbi:hypothetical protein D3C83_101550 [compost metagenome]